MVMYYLCLDLIFFFFFKQKTAYEMRISDWSSDVCSSDLTPPRPSRHLGLALRSTDVRSIPPEIERAYPALALAKTQRAAERGHRALDAAAARAAPAPHSDRGRGRAHQVDTARGGERRGDLGIDADAPDETNRKRVVKGKTWSVRVDRSGPRNHKK